MIDLTTGPTFRNMLLFSLPIMLQGSFQIAYNLVDRFWVGKLGKEALAAVSVGFPVMFFMISLVIGIAIGAGIIIAQYRGAMERELVSRTARNFIAFGVLASLVISAAMIFFVQDVLSLLDTPREILYPATLYLMWIFSGLIFFFIYNGATGIYRGLGDSITPVKVAAFSTVLNIGLDPVFIFGLGPVPAMGVEGAGIATMLANAVGAAVIFGLLAREKEWLDLSLANFRFDRRIIWDILRLGLPSSATMVMISFSGMVIMYFVNRIGTAAIAAYGIGFTLDSLLMMPAQSFGMAMSTIAGQNIGAGKWDRVGRFLRDTLMVSAGIALVVGTFLVVSTPWITRIFQPDPVDYDEVFPLVQIYVQIMLLRYVTMSMFFPINGTIRGAGDAMAAMVQVILTQLIIRIPVVMLLTPFLHFAGVAWALALSTVGGLTIAAVYYRTGRWKQRALIVQHLVGMEIPSVD